MTYAIDSNLQYGLSEAASRDRRTFNIGYFAFANIGYFAFAFAALALARSSIDFAHRASQ
jgi:hypothetical protein